jgi:hypothetical protein
MWATPAVAIARHDLWITARGKLNLLRHMRHGPSSATRSPSGHPSGTTNRQPHEQVDRHQSAGTSKAEASEAVTKIAAV